MRYAPLGPLRGELRLPGDKSICHRAILLGGIAEGDTRIENFSGGGDNKSTLRCLRAMGVRIDELDAYTLLVHGVGLHGLHEPEDVLDAGNSGTTIRLLTGLLAGQPFFSVLTGDPFLRNRPMRRVIAPLRSLGAEIRGRAGDTRAPLAIAGHPLRGTHIELEVASAQVKSALLLAGLYAEGETSVTEPGPSRDHTERMLTYMGASLTREGNRVAIQSGRRLRGSLVQVPGDISSAAFFMVAATIVPGSAVRLRDVGLNPTRTGIVDILRSMGADIRFENERTLAGEPVGDIVVRHAPLHGVHVAGDVVVRAIDEFPILAVAATQAEGETVIEGAGELRVKETDRIRAMTSELRKLGADVEELPEGMRIRGGRPLSGGVVDSFHDHRIAMSLAIAAQVASNAVEITHFDMVAISYPGFDTDLGRLVQRG